MNPGTVVKGVKVVYDKSKEAHDKAKAKAAEGAEKNEEELEEIVEEAKKAFDDEDFGEEDYQKMLEEDLDAMKKRGEV